jgi:hypothetical protein
MDTGGVAPMKSEHVTYTAEERADLFARAASLVNPASGIANDYLNVFFELLLLVENLPDFPEMIDDIENWKPVSYREYFQKSRLPGSAVALQIYDSLDARSRHDFERMVSRLNRVALTGIADVQQCRDAEGQFRAPDLATLCGRFSAELKDCLVPTTNFVNNGQPIAEETAQQMVDRVLFSE